MKITDNYQCISKQNIQIDHIQFNSQFDSGNIKSVQYINSTYQINIACDCEDRIPIFKKKMAAWFYFSILSYKELLNQKFSILNLLASLVKKIFKQGKNIFYLYSDSPQILGYKQNWQNLQCNHSIVDKDLILNFTLNIPQNTYVFIAMNIPFSLSDMNDYLDNVQKRCNIYFHREIICNSLCHLPIECVTITSKHFDNSVQNVEDLIFPDILFPNKNRALKFQNRKYIMIISRIHPGVTCSTHVLKGLIDYLASGNCEQLLQQFVFVIMPIANPDGVFRGNQRFCAIGYDNNRIYNRRYTIKKFKNIFAIRQLAKYYDSQYGIQVFYDLHAHYNISNCFTFGNKSGNLDLDNDIKLIPFILSQLNPLQFSFKKLSKFGLNKSCKNELNEYDWADQYLSPVEKALEDSIYVGPNSQKQGVKYNHSGKKSDDENDNNEEKELNQMYIEEIESGIGKSFLYHALSTQKVYTVEVNYHCYINNLDNGGEILGAWTVQQFQQFGQQLIQALEIYYGINKSLDINQIKNDLVSQSHENQINQVTQKDQSECNCQII